MKIRYWILLILFYGTLVFFLGFQEGKIDVLKQEVQILKSERDTLWKDSGMWQMKYKDLDSKGEE